MTLNRSSRAFVSLVAILGLFAVPLLAEPRHAGTLEAAPAPARSDRAHQPVAAPPSGPRQPLLAPEPSAVPLSFSGYLRWTDGTAAAQVTMEAVALAGDAPVAGAVTQPDGFFRFPALEATAYRLTARDGNGPPLPMLAPDVDLAGKNGTMRQDFLLYRAATGPAGPRTALGIGVINGTVTFGGPVASVTLSLFDYEGNFVASTTTNGAGFYQFTSLDTMTYYVRFNGNAAAPYEYFGTLFEDTIYYATPIGVVSGGPAQTRDFTLGPGGHITGRVTGADSGSGLEGVQVIISGEGNSYQSTFTSPGGYYTSPTALRQGSYLVQFDPSGAASAVVRSYVPQYYSGADTPSFARAVTVSVPLTTTNINAQLTRGVNVTGRVFAQDGVTPLENAQVSILHPSYNYANALVYGATDATGRYTFNRAVRPGQYRFRFDPPNGTAYLGEFHSDKTRFEDAGYFTLAGVGLVNGPDASLSLGVQFRGRVTDEGTGAGIEGVSVSARDTSYTFYAYSATDASGYYTTTPGLPAGNYRLEFTPYAGTPADAYLGEAHDNKPLSEPGDLVAAPATGFVTVNAALAKGVRITGQVSEADTGRPIRQGAVTLYKANGDWVGAVSTAPDGAYALAAVPPGQYKLYFAPNQYSAPLSFHLPEYHNNKPTLAAADAINIVAGPPVVINAALTPGARVQGDISGPSPAPTFLLPDVNAILLDLATGNQLMSARTDGHGVFWFRPGVLTGTYKLRFAPAPDGLSRGYLPEYHDDKQTLESATPLTVPVPPPGFILPVLAAGGIISGVVTVEGTGQPVQGARIEFKPVSGGPSSFTESDYLGRYASPGLITGTYKVSFRPPPGGLDATLLAEFYDNQLAEASAAAVAVTAPNVTPNINAALTRGSVLSGRITAEADGSPIAGASINVYRASDGAFAGYATTDPAGNYRLTEGLRSGSYRIWVYGPAVTGNQFLQEYYNNKYFAETADLVTVTNPNPVTVDLALAREAIVKGRVTAQDTGAGLPQVYISLMKPDGATVSSVPADPTGYYTFTGLLAGSYKLFFSTDSVPAAFPYVSEYHNNKATLESADTIAVATGATVEVNAALARAASIRGVVTGADTSAPLAGVFVSASNTETGYQVGSGTTDATGAYTITPGLPAGTYRLSFQPDSTGPSATYVPEYYDDKLRSEDATPLFVGEAAVLTINAALARGVRVFGAVTEEGTGVPLPDVNVTIYDSDGQSVAGGFTGVTGRYTATVALLPGAYRFQFSPYFTGRSRAYIAEFHSNKATLATADPIAMALPGPATVDAALAKGTVINGRVTGSDTAAGLPGIRVEVYDAATNTFAASATTDATGVYSTGPGLKAGSYRVSFFPSAGPSGRYLPEYYNNVTTVAEATLLVAAPPAPLNNIDAVLDPGGVLAGTVTDRGTGARLADVYVNVYSASGSYVASGFTNAAGEYVTNPGLRPGTYIVEFSPSTSGGARAYSRLYYNDKWTYETADPVTISGPGTISNINAALYRWRVAAGLVVKEYAVTAE